MGDLQPMALPGESYKLALTPGLIAHVFKRQQSDGAHEDLLPDPASLLEGKGADQGGYVDRWTEPGGFPRARSSTIPTRISITR